MRRKSAKNTLVGESHYDGLRATDGTDISTRRKHQEYMKKNNLATIDDFKNTWAGSQQKREMHYNGTDPATRRERREDVERAIYHLEKNGGKRPQQRRP